MEKWKLRYEHDRDMQKYQCQILGIEVPEEKYGTLKLMPDIWRVWKGKEFHKLMEQEDSHDSFDFDCCKCNNR